MIIKTTLSWETHEGKQLGLFSGYYDMHEDWKTIGKVYLAFNELAELVRTVSKLPGTPVRLLRDGNVVHVVARGISTELTIDRVWSDGHSRMLYALPTKLLPHTRWINWERSQDVRQYGWNQVYRSLIEAISIGITTGLAGHVTLSDLTVEEWAWLYVIGSPSREKDSTNPNHHPYNNNDHDDTTV